MDKELAKSILKLVDTPEMVEILVRYADFESDKAFKGLSVISDPVEIHRLQGVVRAMTVLKTIRDQALQAVK